MRTVEECYEYVLKRCDELAAQRRRKRGIALKAAAPVCGIAVIAGTAAVLRNGRMGTKEQISIAENSIISAENSAVESTPKYEDSAFSSAETQNSAAEIAPKYENRLDIGEVEITSEGAANLYCIPGLYEMTRDEVLEHFRLSTEFDLSGAVDGLRETAPRNGILNGDGRHGFCRGYVIEENGYEHWEELTQMFEHDEFVFENADCTKTATVIFDRDERVDWLRSGIMCPVGDGRYSNEPFYSLPASEIAGVEMRIAKRNIGGYYAEFNTGALAVGLIAEGLSEDETVDILEYLAEYVGAAKTSAENSVSAGSVEIAPPFVIN